MKLTCLSNGGIGGDAYHFPPSHILELCGFRILLECPIDLSTLTLFSPLPLPPQSPNSPTLLQSLPRYKTLTGLHLWDPSLIDAVLVSSPAGMLGLPFLTRFSGFAARIYATELTVKIGRSLMEELVSMHDEFVMFYGPENGEEPEWMKWEEMERMPPAVRDVVMGEGGEELGSWMPLYRYL